jgi:hypothetical protein
LVHRDYLAALQQVQSPYSESLREQNVQCQAIAAALELRVEEVSLLNANLWLQLQEAEMKLCAFTGGGNQTACGDPSFRDYHDLSACGKAEQLTDDEGQSQEQVTTAGAWVSGGCLDASSKALASPLDEVVNALAANDPAVRDQAMGSARSDSDADAVTEEVASSASERAMFPGVNGCSSIKGTLALVGKPKGPAKPEEQMPQPSVWHWKSDSEAERSDTVAACGTLAKQPENAGTVNDRKGGEADVRIGEVGSSSYHRWRMKRMQQSHPDLPWHELLPADLVS